MYVTGRFFGGHPENVRFMQFSQNIDGFRQNYSQGLYNSCNSKKQKTLEKCLIFTIYQNYTLALSCCQLVCSEIKLLCTIIFYHCKFEPK